MRSSLALAFLVAVTAVARAQPGDDGKTTYHASVDRVDLEPASIGGYRLRVYLSALSLQGQLLDLGDPRSIRLFLGTAEKKLPFALGTYGATDAETEIIFVVQATGDFAEALPQIADSLEHAMIAHLRDTVKVGIAMYGESVTTPKLANAKALKGKIALASDNSVADPALLDAIERALLTLKKAKPDVEGRPQRKMIVVIGDGRDAAADHDRVTRIGARAAKEGVRIHALAYSAADLRRPLLVLGELAKRSFGTLRWPGQGRRAIAETWNDAFKQLIEEVEKQNVITFFASADDDVAGKKLHIVLAGRTEATSNEVRVPALATCNGSACEGYCAGGTCASGTRGGHGGAAILRWVLIIGGGLVGLAVVLAVIGWWITKRQERADESSASPRGVAGPGTPAAAPAPGLLANGRPIPGLLVMTGPRTGERLILRHGFLVGGQPASDLQIQDGYTSSNHAQLTMDADGNCVVIDLGSTNGTFVNGMPITQQALSHGMTIKIGTTELRFLTE